MGFIVKNTTIISPLDLLAPHSCRGCGRLGKVLCDCCKNNIVAAHSHQNPPQIPHDMPPTFILGKREGLLDALIHDFKYSSIRALGPELASLLNTTLPPLPQHSVVVPLPTAPSHVRARGLDHTLILAKYLAKLRHLKVGKILLRNQNTSQVGSNRKTRLAQADSTYFINPKAKIDPTTTYILLDDVWTTGASMRAAIKKLQQAGASQIIVVLLAMSSLD